MTEQTPEPQPGTNRLRRFAGGVGASLGCLMLLVGFVIAVAGVVAIFLDDPTFVIAGAALIVALAAYKVTRRNRRR